MKRLLKENSHKSLSIMLQIWAVAFCTPLSSQILDQIKGVAIIEKWFGVCLLLFFAGAVFFALSWYIMLRVDLALNKRKKNDVRR